MKGSRMICGVPRAVMVSLGVCALYGLASLSLSMLNKVLLSSYKFDCYFILLCSQLIVSYSACVITRDYFGNPFSVPLFEWKLVSSGFTMGAIGVVNIGLGLMALQMVNVPMFFCLRRLVAPVVLLYEYVSMGKVADVGVRGSISVIVAGAIIAGWDTFNDDLIGYSLTLLNNLMTAASSVSVRVCSSGALPLLAAFTPPTCFVQQKQFSDKTRLPTVAIVYVNALVAAPMTLALALATGEFERFAVFEHTGNGMFWVGFFVSVLMGLVLTYSSMLCTTYNSPLATSVTGNAKDIATTIIGWLAFPGFVATIKSVGGILVSFFGAFLYSYVNLQKEFAKQRERDAVKDKGGQHHSEGAVAGGGAISTGAAAAAAVEAEGGGSGGPSADDVEAALAPRQQDTVPLTPMTPMGSLPPSFGGGAAEWESVPVPPHALLPPATPQGFASPTPATDNSVFPRGSSPSSSNALLGSSAVEPDSEGQDAGAPLFSSSSAASGRRKA